MKADLTAVGRWAREPHIRVGDPCYLCGIPMVPASRHWPSWARPAEHHVHGSYGLCRPCYQLRLKDQSVAELVAQARAAADTAHPHRGYVPVTALTGQ